MVTRSCTKRRSTTKGWNGQPRTALEKKRYGRKFNNNKFKATVHRSTGGFCVCCMDARSQVIHHFRYVRPDGSAVKNTERCPQDLVPLCFTCHEVAAHSSENWIKHRSKPMLNHNTDWFREQMIRNWQKLNDLVLRIG